MNQNQVPLRCSCSACSGEGYLPTNQTFILCGREHMQIVRCFACDGKGTILKWVDLQEVVMLVRAIEAEQLGFPKTLVGVDIITHNELLAADVGERQILEMLEHRPLGLIITPTGGQGFLLGRGNQQISPDVIRRVKDENILVICLASKIAALQGRPLLVDSGNYELDHLLTGYIKVITGYHEKIIYRLGCGS